MKSRKLKTLAVAVVLSLTIGAVPPVTGNRDSDDHDHRGSGSKESVLKSIQ